jgi:hypothetical protein
MIYNIKLSLILNNNFDAGKGSIFLEGKTL